MRKPQSALCYVFKINIKRLFCQFFIQYSKGFLSILQYAATVPFSDFSISACHNFIFAKLNSAMKTYRYIISGTVKNLASGNFEVFTQGDEASISQFESFLHMEPRMARVEQVVKEVLDEQMEYQGFDIGW
jgi:acylphosphatase